MGRLLLVCRLAARDLRRHPAQAGLLLLAITAAATTLTLALALHGVTSRPYQQTRACDPRPRRGGLPVRSSTSGAGRPGRLPERQRR